MSGRIVIAVGPERVRCGPFGLFSRPVVWTEAIDAADLTNGGLNLIGLPSDNHEGKGTMEPFITYFGDPESGRYSLEVRTDRNWQDEGLSLQLFLHDHQSGGTVTQIITTADSKEEVVRKLEALFR